MLGDTTELQRLADRRAKEIVQLREEQTKIMQENDQLRLLVSHRIRLELQRLLPGESTLRYCHSGFTFLCDLQASTGRDD
jgi:hypothetical protein